MGKSTCRPAVAIRDPASHARPWILAGAASKPSLYIQAGALSINVRNAGKGFGRLHAGVCPQSCCPALDTAAHAADDRVYYTSMTCYKCLVVLMGCAKPVIWLVAQPCDAKECTVCSVCLVCLLANGGFLKLPGLGTRAWWYWWRGEMHLNAPRDVCAYVSVHKHVRAYLWHGPHPLPVCACVRARVQKSK